MSVDCFGERLIDFVALETGVCDAGVDAERLVAQLYAVIAKNNAKPHETHVVADGKIRRHVPKA